MVCKGYKIGAMGFRVNTKSYYPNLGQKQMVVHDFVPEIPTPIDNPHPRRDPL